MKNTTIEIKALTPEQETEIMLAAGYAAAAKQVTDYYAATGDPCPNWLHDKAFRDGCAAKRKEFSA